MTLIEYLDSVAGSDLRTTERAVLWWLARRAVKAGGQLGVAWPSMADIVWGTGASRATVARSLAILRASGWLEAVRSEVGQVVVYRLVTPGPNPSHSETGGSHVETGVGGGYQSHSETGGVSYGDGGSLTVRRGESHSETRKKQMKKQEKLSEDNPTPASVESYAEAARSLGIDKPPLPPEPPLPSEVIEAREEARRRAAAAASIRNKELAEKIKAANAAKAAARTGI
jgi:hypothetical protein